MLRARGAEVLAEDLARRRLGDGVDELDAADLLIWGDPGCDEVDDFLCGEVDAGLADDEGLGDFLTIVIGDANDGGVGDGRVGEQHRFEFGGRDLVALVFDQLLEPIDDEYPAGVIDLGEVAGVQKPIVVDGGGLLALSGIRPPDSGLSSLMP